MPRRWLLQSSRGGERMYHSHIPPIVARYTMVYDGKPTVVGLRGYQAVQTIEQAGAENQKSPELLAAIYGDVVTRSPSSGRSLNQKNFNC